MNQQHFTLQNSIQYLQEYKGIQDFTVVKLIDENNNRYIYPVLTSKCQHIKFAINLETVLNAINFHGHFTCECNSTVCHPKELQKDIRWSANEINEFFDNGLVFHNKLFNDFKRDMKYTAAIKDSTAFSKLKTLLEQQNSNDINKILQRMSQNYQNQKNICFKVICLLDFVQLNIPVRFNACQHPECYDLASLLVYYNENSINKSQVDQLKQFKCKQWKCPVKVDISTVEKIFQNIYIDKELLKMIMKGLPSIYKYSYNLNTRQIQQDSIIRDEVIIVDQEIYQRYTQEINQQVSPSSKAYQDYQKQVIRNAYTILQRTSNEIAKQKLQLFKYKIFQIPAIIEKIEQPARCTNCDISQVMELKQLISSFQSQKDRYKQQVRPLKCPLCGKEFDYLRTIFSSAIYFDKNLFDALEQGFLKKSDQTYKYNGKKLMWKEFRYKQKLDLEEFKQDLLEQQQNLTCTFTQLYCCSDPTRPISMPLILKNCPKKSIVDFESFYNCIEQLEVENYEKQCLQFCKCKDCSKNPFSFQQIAIYVYFDEPFSTALVEFNKLKSKSKPNQFTYDFQSNRIIEEIVHSLSIKEIVIREESFSKGFEGLLDDVEYQKKFKPKFFKPNQQERQQEKEQFAYQVLTNEFDTKLFKIYNIQQGYKGESSNKVNKFNESMQKNELAVKYGFSINETKTDINDSFLQLTKGIVNSKYH